MPTGITKGTYPRILYAPLPTDYVEGPFIIPVIALASKRVIKYPDVVIAASCPFNDCHTAIGNSVAFVWTRDPEPTPNRLNLTAFTLAGYRYPTNKHYSYGDQPVGRPRRS